MDNATPGQVVLGIVSKQIEQALRDNASKQQSSMTFASVPALTSLMVDYISCKINDGPER